MKYSHLNIILKEPSTFTAIIIVIKTDIYHKYNCVKLHKNYCRKDIAAIHNNFKMRR